MSVIKTQHVVIAAIGVILCVILFVGGCAGIKEFDRYQTREDAINKTAVVKQAIKTADEQAKVNKAQIAATIADAEKRLEEAKGIRAAQDKIAATLTPLYVQHEAIEAQKKALGKGNAQIYIPSGEQGVPLTRATNPSEGQR